MGDDERMRSCAKVCHHCADSGRDDGELPAGVQITRERITPHCQRQGDEDLDPVIVHTFEKAVSDESENHAEDDAADSFLQQQACDVPAIRCCAGIPDEHFVKDRENDDADAVVEKRFACDARFQFRRGVCALE